MTKKIGKITFFHFPTHIYFVYMDYYCFRFVSVAPFQPRWRGLMHIFTGETWIVFAIMLIISSIAWFTYGNILPEASVHRSFAQCFLNSWSVFLGMDMYGWVS